MVVFLEVSTFSVRPLNVAGSGSFNLKCLRYSNAIHILGLFRLLQHWRVPPSALVSNLRLAHVRFFLVFNCFGNILEPSGLVLPVGFISSFVFIMVYFFAGFRRFLSCLLWFNNLPAGSING
jgi:hypothetical protein